VIAAKGKTPISATEKLKTIHEDNEEGAKKTISTIQADTHEQLQISPTDFLVAEACDNYSELYWKNGKELSKKLLRITLKNLEPQISNDHIVRCHRSYLVNLKAVKEVTGNASGYKLIIQDFKKAIPVSRSLAKVVIERIKSL